MTRTRCTEDAEVGDSGFNLFSGIITTKPLAS